MVVLHAWKSLAQIALDFSILFIETFFVIKIIVFQQETNILPNNLALYLPFILFL